MNRKAKKPPKQKIDLFKPIKAEDFMDKVTNNDCFGNLWDGAYTECKTCGVEAVCATICRKNHKAQEKKLEQQEGPYLDQVRELSEAQQSKIVSFVKASELDNPVTSSELFSTIKKLMKTKDDVAAVQYVKRFVRGNGLKISEGKVYSK